MAQPIFSFDIGDEVLTVSPQDTAVVGDTAFSTGLGSDDYSPLLTRAFAVVLGNPLSSCVTKREFDAAMRELLPEVGGWSDARKEQISYFLSNLFYAFDRDGREAVPTDEVLVALSFLCGGSKTAKLAFAFALFDANGEDGIDQAELARLLSSLLTGLFALCAASNALDEDEVVSRHQIPHGNVKNHFPVLVVPDNEASFIQVYLVKRGQISYQGKIFVFSIYKLE